MFYWNVYWQRSNGILHKCVVPADTRSQAEAIFYSRIPFNPTFETLVAIVRIRCYEVSNA